MKINDFRTNFYIIIMKKFYTTYKIYNESWKNNSWKHNCCT